MYYVCMYGCVHVVCMHVRIHEYMKLGVRCRAYLQCMILVTQPYTCMYVCMFVCMYVRKHECIKLNKAKCRIYLQCMILVRQPYARMYVCA